MEGFARTTTTAFTLEVDRNGVGWLTFDQPGSRVNLLNSDTMAQLDRLLSELESRIANGRLVAAVVRSGKPGRFIAGAEVSEIAGLSGAAEAHAKSREGQRIFRRLDRLRVPTVAAVDGACVGGGAELILACDWRIVSDRGATRIGFPEVRLGILPGFGGTVRLPRLVGIRNALDLLLTGRTVSPRRAQRIGLVDRVAEHDRFGREVEAFVSEAVRRGLRDPEPSLGLAGRLLEGTGLGRRLLFFLARRRVERESKGHYPAPDRILDVVERTAAMSLEEALEVEAEVLGELAASEVSRGLVRVFLISQAARHALPSSVLEQARPVRRVAVLGAGVMGGGIAEVTAAADIPVTLKEVDEKALESGLRHARELLFQAARKKVFTAEEAKLKADRIEGALDYEGFSSVDLAIEAVVERMPVKQQVLRDVEERVHDEAVFATNTSSLSVAELAQAARCPERVLGLHFFNPVHRMPLVEVVRTERTSDAALATAFDFALTLGKTPVIVADRAGFLVNRLLAPYLNEAGRLVREGCGVREVDRALVEFGMPMGPLRLLDEIGFDIAEHAAREMTAALGERVQPPGVLRELLEQGRLGKKNNRGFYRYEKGKEKGVDPAVERRWPRDPARASAPEEIRRRCLYLMVNEAAFALEEAVVASADEVDLALIMGTGFPPFRGGLLRWADREGIPRVVEALGGYAERFGPRFTPAPLLGRMGERGQTFTRPL